MEGGLVAKVGRDEGDGSEGVGGSVEDADLSLRGSAGALSRGRAREIGIAVVVRVVVPGAEGHPLVA